MTRKADLPDTLVASFTTPDRAKAAMATLERNGVSTGNVQLLSPIDASVPVQQADERKIQWLTGHAVRGGLIGLVIGALVIGIGVSIVWEGEKAGAVLAAALGGAVAGAFIGAFVAIGINMPRNPGAWDTYLLAHGDEACIGVTLRSSEQAAALSDLLSREGATSVERIP